MKATERSTTLMLWVSFAASATVIGVISVCAILGTRVTWNGGCGDDGAYYCQMTRGDVVPQPYNQRVLVPWIVHTIGGTRNPPRFFLLLNLFSLVAIGGATWVLTQRIAASFGASVSRQRAAAATAAALALTAPMALRWTAFYPTLVDHPALALEMWWLVALTDKRPSLRVASAPLPALAVLAKESSIVTVAIVALSLMIVSRKHRLPALIGLAVCLPAVGFVLSRPSLFPLHLLPFVWRNIRSFAHLRGAANLVWAILLSFGLLPFILLRVRASIRAALRSELFVPLIAAGVAPFVIVGLAGSDVARYLYAAVPATLAGALGAAAADSRLDPLVAGATAANLVLTRPFEVLHGSIFEYLRSFAPYYLGEATLSRRLLSDLVIVIACGIFVLTIESAQSTKMNRIVQTEDP